MRPTGSERACRPCEPASLSQSLSAPFPAPQLGGRLPGSQSKRSPMGEAQIIFTMAPQSPPRCCPYTSSWGSHSNGEQGPENVLLLLQLLRGKAVTVTAGRVRVQVEAVGHPLAFPSRAPRVSVWVGWGCPRAALSRAWTSSSKLGPQPGRPAMRCHMSTRKG